jgi:hypothetical protein
MPGVMNSNPVWVALIKMLLIAQPVPGCNTLLSTHIYNIGTRTGFFFRNFQLYPSSHYTYFDGQDRHPSLAVCKSLGGGEAGPPASGLASPHINLKTDLPGFC